MFVADSGFVSPLFLPPFPPLLLLLSLFSVTVVRIFNMRSTLITKLKAELSDDLAIPLLLVFQNN